MPHHSNLLNQLENFSLSGQDALFHFVSTCSKKIIHKEILLIPVTDFPEAGLPAMGSNVFFQMQPPLLIARVIW